MAMKMVGREGDAYLVVDGLVGAVIAPGREPLIKASASLRAHMEFDDFDGPIPDWAPADLADALATYRRQWEQP